MNTRTLLTVLAVVAFAFVATNCLAAVDANKPGDANKPADINKPGKTTVSVVDFSKYTEEDKGKKGCDKDKDPNKGKGCEKDPNKATIINASDFGTLAEKGKADANKPADVNKPAEPNKSKLAVEGEKDEKGKGHHHKKDPNQMEPNQPKDANDKK